MLVADLELASAQMPLITNLHMSAPYATTERRSETSKTNPTARMEMMMMMMMMMMPEWPGREEQDPCNCGNAAHEVGLCLAVKNRRKAPHNRHKSS